MYGLRMWWKRFVSAGGGYPFAVAGVAVAAVAFLPLRSYLSITVVMLLFVPVIMGIARVAGVRPTAVAAIVAFLALDFLYIPPYYRLTVAELAEWIGLIVFLIIALVAGQQTAVLREREKAAVRRQSELELLNLLSFRIASEKSVASTAEFVTDEVVSVLHASRAAIYAPAPGGAMTGRCLSSAGAPTPSSGEEALVAWVLRTGKGISSAPGHTGTEQGMVTVEPAAAIPGVVADGLFLPLLTASGIEGVLFARFLPAEPGEDDIRLLVAVANLAAASLERQRLQEEAAHAEVLREADRLKSTLVSSVSHELKTPLAAATARVTGLLDEGDSRTVERTTEELEAVAEDLTRLNSSIGDLLDLSRLESDSWQPHFEEHDVRDVLGTMLSRLPGRSRERLEFTLPDELPNVRIDFAQLVRALENLVENALAYSPADSMVTVGAGAGARSLRVWVEDRGPGIDPTEKELVFEKFYRGAASTSSPAGTGLGLAIARELVRSQDGELRVEDAAPHGARFVLELPVATGGADE